MAEKKLAKLDLKRRVKEFFSYKYRGTCAGAFTHRLSGDSIIHATAI